jgi:hypothetical protein
MRYQLRLIGEDLVGFHLHLAKHAWSVLSMLLPERGRWGAYRSLFRRLKATLDGRIEARKYCGQASACDAFLHAVDPGEGYRKTVPRPEAELTRHYLLKPDVTPGQLVGELSRQCLVVLSEAKPGARIKGAGRRLHRAVRESLHGRLYRNESCGGTKLCEVNEPADLWNLMSVPEGAKRSGRRG